MPANYPASLDALSDPGATLAGPPLHSTMHNQINDILEAIEAELGVAPSGTAATVVARLGGIEAELTNLRNNFTGADSAIRAEFAAADVGLDALIDANKATADAGIAANAARFKHGMVTLTFNNSPKSNLLSVNFAGGAFAGTPTMLVTSSLFSGNTPVAVGVTTVDATGFAVQGINATVAGHASGATDAGNANINGTISVFWVAMFG